MIEGFVCSTLSSAYLTLTPKHNAGMGQDIFCEEAYSNHTKNDYEFINIHMSESQCTFNGELF